MIKTKQMTGTKRVLGGAGNLGKNNKYIRYFVNRKFAVDAVCMAIFWVIVYTPVYLYTSKSLEALH